MRRKIIPEAHFFFKIEKKIIEVVQYQNSNAIKLGLLDTYILKYLEVPFLKKCLLNVPQNVIKKPHKSRNFQKLTYFVFNLFQAIFERF